MEMDKTYYFSGIATKYFSVIAGSSVFITSDSPKDYILAGLFGFVYFGGELLQKKSLENNGLKNLENNLDSPYTEIKKKVNLLGSEIDSFIKRVKDGDKK